MVQGKLVCGSILDLSKPVCLHASSCFHQTEPWEGDRVVIVVFTVQFEATLTSSDVRQLMSLGFPLPLSTGDCAANPEPTKFACLDPTATNLPLIVEVFAGSARVTECCRELGLRADAIDHKPHALSKVQPLLLDLTSEDGRRGLRSVLAHPDLRAVWWAPPCGTASKARCIPLDVPNAPRPLRTEESPDGVAGLTPLEQARVDSANTLYHLLADSVIHTIKKGVIHVVENPRSSLFWKTSAWLRVRNTAFQNCAYGARRPKHTALAFTHSAFKRFNRSCPGITCSKHHLPWGLSSSGFATAEESIYPVPLCKEVAAAFQEIFQQSQHHAGLDYHRLRASTGLQPKASKTVPVVSEHKCLVTWSGPEHLCRMPCRRMERLAHPLPIPSLCQCSLDTLPAGAQLLHMHTSVKQGDGSSSCVSVWGIPYNPREFIQAALKSAAVAAAKVPEPLLSAIRESKKCNPEILAKTRTDTLKQWAMRAKALESEEERFKSGLHPDVAKILAPKRLLLWKELMARYSYPDTGVFDLITSGVSLTGEVENSGLFNSVNKPATLSVQQLREEADNITDETLAQVRPQSPEIDQTVLRKTLQEVENGWLTGPIPRHLVPPGSVVCRRFGLCQGEKTRLIDDMRPVNQTVSTFESPRPHTVDVLAAMGRELMSACPGVPIQGKAFDRTAAYRQLPLRPDAAWVSFISIWDCERKEPALFRLKALPFGASKSVYSFLRTSHSLWWLACKALSIVWTLYYDDFVCMSSKALASHTDNCVRAFFFLLGWKFSSSGDKHKTFSRYSGFQNTSGLPLF